MKDNGKEINCLNTGSIDQSARKIGKSHLKTIDDSEYLFIVVYSLKSVHCLFQEELILVGLQQVFNFIVVCLFVRSQTCVK